MFRKMALTICLMGSCLWCFALATSADSAQPVTTAGVFTPVASVSSLMHGQGKFFKEISQALGNMSNPERNEEIGYSAEVLAELANVNRFNKNKEDYRGWATQLRDKALQLAREADKKEKANESHMKKLFQEMKNTCVACHDVYQ